MQHDDPFLRLKPSGTRPLKVGEELRRALSEIFLRGECHDPELHGVSITVSEVRVSPEMKNATAYFMPLAGNNKEAVLATLTRLSPELRHMVTKKVKMRHVPRLHFVLDTSFDEAHRINELLHSEEVKRDL